MKGLVEVLIEAIATGQGRVLWQQGVCAHQGSHAPAYDTPALSGGGALFNKACHPLGPILYLKQALLIPIIPFPSTVVFGVNTRLPILLVLFLMTFLS